MPYSDRKPSKRSLSFESLEARKSLTALWPAAVDPVSEVAQSSTIRSSNYLLLYVDSMEQISIDRDTPASEEAIAVDRFIAETSPLHFDSH